MADKDQSIINAEGLGMQSEYFEEVVDRKFYVGDGGGEVKGLA
jgi:hypothetical protein